jgi:predicted PurR-regulated permease PerM
LSRTGRLGRELLPTADGQGREIPWRRYYAAVFRRSHSVVVAMFLLVELRRWSPGWSCCGFFAVVLAPAVELFERRFHQRRGLAVGVVVTLTTLVVLGVIVAIAVRWFVRHRNLATNFSDYVNEAQQRAEAHWAGLSDASTSTNGRKTTRRRSRTSQISSVRTASGSSVPLATWPSPC